MEWILFNLSFRQDQQDQQDQLDICFSRFPDETVKIQSTSGGKNTLGL
jgi:hypothetical protein